MPMTEVNGVRLHYHLQGKGTPIVFLHPPCIGSRIFTYLRNDLSRDHRTLLFDFRGHGRSGTSRAALTIPLLVEDTRQLMDALEIPSAYLCTYSLASMVALEALLSHPDRFRGAMMLSGMAAAEGRRTRAKLIGGQIAGTLRAKDLISVPVLWANSDNLYTYRRLRAETLAGDVTKWKEYLREGSRYSAVERLGDIRQPVLLLAGERDEEFKRHARTLQRGLLHDSTAYLPGLKHALPTQGADGAGSLIRGWLYAQEGIGREGMPHAHDAGSFVADADHGNAEHDDMARL